MQVVATVGMPGSGKGEFAAVADEMGYPVVRMGDVIREEAERRGVEPSDANLGAIATELREEHGDDVIARRCVDAVRDRDAELVVVDGVRGIDEVETFRDAFGDDLALVAVEAPFEDRLERLDERGRSDDVSSEEALERRDERELGYGMGEAIEAADTTVANDGSLAAFRERARAMLRKVRDDGDPLVDGSQ